MQDDIFNEFIRQSKVAEDDPFKNQLKLVREGFEEWSNGVKENTFDPLVKVLSQGVVQDEIIKKSEELRGQYTAFLDRLGEVKEVDPRNMRSAANILVGCAQHLYENWSVPREEPPKKEDFRTSMLLHITQPEYKEPFWPLETPIPLVASEEPTPMRIKTTLFALWGAYLSIKVDELRKHLEDVSYRQIIFIPAGLDGRAKEVLRLVQFIGVSTSVDEERAKKALIDPEIYCFLFACTEYAYETTLASQPPFSQDDFKKRWLGQLMDYHNKMDNFDIGTLWTVPFNNLRGS